MKNIFQPIQCASGYVFRPLRFLLAVLAMTAAMVALIMLPAYAHIALTGQLLSFGG